MNWGTKRRALVWPALAAVLSTFTLAESSASAAVPCQAGRCSTGTANLRLEGKDALRTSIDTGWMPSCDNGQEHCNKGLQVRADLAIAPPKNGSLFVLNMPGTGVVQASWDNRDMLGLQLAPGAAAGSITLTHTLSPRIEFFIDIGPIESAEPIVIDGTKLVNKLPGAQFNYLATAAAATPPGWLFGGTSLVVPAPSLQATEVLSVNLQDLPDIVDKVVTGSVALHARTQPKVTIKMRRVLIGGTSVTETALSNFPKIDGDRDFIDFLGAVELEASAEGDIEVLPSATLARLGDLNFNPPVTITFSQVKATKHFATETDVYTFSDLPIRIPLPNVRPFTSADRIEAGVGTTGNIAAPTLNTGEAQAEVTLTSSDSHFVVPTGAIKIPPRSTKNLDIGFEPQALETSTATITIHSNDPDTPEFSFTVEGKGIPAPPEGTAGGGKKKPGAAGADGEGPSGDSGCGCKTAGATTGAGTLGFLGILGLPLLVWQRRRRSARA